MSHVKILDFNGNPNIGLHAFATDKFCLVGNFVTEEQIKTISETLSVPVYPISIAGTSLIGVFAGGNEEHLLIPAITFEHELEVLRKLAIPFTVVDTKFTALGNNIVINDKGILCNPELETDVKKLIRETYKLPLREELIVKQPTVGSCLLLNDKGGIIHIDAADKQIEELSGFFGVPIEIGTVNNAVPQVSSGIIANSNGFCIGKQSTGPEITNADEVLGFLYNE